MVLTWVHEGADLLLSFSMPPPNGNFSPSQDKIRPANVGTTLSGIYDPVAAMELNSFFMGIIKLTNTFTVTRHLLPEFNPLIMK